VSKKPKDFGDWAIRHIGKLRRNADLVKNISPEITYGPKGEWIVTKLLILGYWIDIYTAIIANQIRQKNFDAMYYVDLLAGSGLCTVQRESPNKGEIIAGSSVVAATYCHTPFTKYLLVEKTPAMAKVLDARMKALGMNVEVLVKDCNAAIASIVSNFGFKGHYLAFVDNEGCDVKWSTMETLLKHYGDVWIIFQTSEIARAVDTTSYREFLGLNTNEAPPKNVLDYYTTKLKQVRPIVEVVHVPGIRGFSYDMIYVTNTTKSGNPWLQSLEGLRSGVAKLGVDFIKIILDELSGQQTSLKFFDDTQNN